MGLSRFTTSAAARSSSSSRKVSCFLGLTGGSQPVSELVRNTLARSFLPLSANGAPKCCIRDRKSTRLNSSHLGISYAVFCLKKKNTKTTQTETDMTNVGAAHTRVHGCNT